MSSRTFRDRSEAGRLLAKRLSKYAGRRDLIVLALPRGGVPVGHEVTRALNAPFKAVGRWYEDSSQTTDEEVRELLSLNERRGFAHRNDAGGAVRTASHEPQE